MKETTLPRTIALLFAIVDRVVFSGESLEEGNHILITTFIRLLMLVDRNCIFKNKIHFCKQMGGNGMFRA